MNCMFDRYVTWKKKKGDKTTWIKIYERAKKLACALTW